MDLDTQSCGRFSPNIEIKCMLRLQKEALSKLKEALDKINSASIQSSSRDELSKPLNEAKNAITAVLIGEREENNHHRDQNKINSESNLNKALKAASTAISKAQEDLIKAEQEEIAANSLLEDYVYVEPQHVPANEQPTTEDVPKDDHVHTTLTGEDYAHAEF